MIESSKKVETIKSLLRECDSVLIGAGAGLSIAAGLINDGVKFNEKYKDFVEEYHMEDFYSGGFYPFPTPEEKWAYFSRFFIMNLETDSTPLYENILKLVKDKDYFVITTNVDGYFEKAGFEPEQIFAPQGDCVHVQCSQPCHDVLYEAIDLFEEMVIHTKNRKIPTELLPYCPKCGELMDMHLRLDDSYVQDDNYYEQYAAYLSFLERNQNKKLLLLEFGVGFNTPDIIRFPFEKKTMENRKWNLVRFNKDHSGIISHCGYGLQLVDDWDIIQSLRLKNGFQHRFIPVSEDTAEIIQKIVELE